MHGGARTQVPVQVVDRVLVRVMVGATNRVPTDRPTDPPTHPPTHLGLGGLPLVEPSGARRRDPVEWVHAGQVLVPQIAQVPLPNVHRCVCEGGVVQGWGERGPEESVKEGGRERGMERERER